MTIEEKLQHFYDTSVAEAQTEAENTLEAHKKSLEEMLEKHKESRKMDAEAQIKAETENATREVNKALSAEQLTLRRDWTAKQNELRNELFVEVKNHLEDFMASPEYQDYRCTRIQKAREFAGNDEIFIYLSPEDTALQRSIVAKTGFTVEISKEPFMGGIKATIPAKNILIDNSFMSAYEKLKKEFKFDGGLSHE